MNDETPMDRWCRLTDAAMCAPDTQLTDVEFASRYERHAGQPITVETVKTVRDAAWKWSQKQPSVRVGTIRL